MIFRANDSSQNALLLLLPVLICVVFCHLYCVSLLRLLAYLFFFFRPGLGMNITSILRFFEIKRLRKVYHLLVQYVSIL